MQYSKLLQALNLSKRMLYREMISWTGLIINIYQSNVVKQLKSVPKLRANTLSPDMFC